MEDGLIVKIVLSRKGFDSSSGGCPSPMLPDGRMVSLPIPDKQSPIRYADIRWREYNLGQLVTDLTGNRIPATHFAHLDPDIVSESLPRQSGWTPIFGQTGASQGHLRKNGIRPGDIFLFFGLFRNVTRSGGRFVWNKSEPQRHVLWGWLQVSEILQIDTCVPSKYEWARYHPHFHRKPEKNNVLYVARKSLKLQGLMKGRVQGAGTFPFFSQRLALTALNSAKPTQWELPKWFYPRSKKCVLTYHSDMERWEKTKTGTRLNAASRGQEFIMDTEEFPDAIEWVKDLVLRDGELISR